MALRTYAYVGRRRPVPSGRSAIAPARPSQAAARPEQHGRPTDVQVWNWAEGAVLGGYGPPATAFL
ncbi:hypothetical protein [Streptomyces sp. NPDC002952]|uniref:hypothetical protein n=1 Tax=unclassified Streptomyces TaxID=2593676 RepID=UPI00367CEFF7